MKIDYSSISKDPNPNWTHLYLTWEQFKTWKNNKNPSPTPYPYLRTIQSKRRKKRGGGSLYPRPHLHLNPFLYHWAPTSHSPHPTLNLSHTHGPLPTYAMCPLICALGHQLLPQTRSIVFQLAWFVLNFHLKFFISAIIESIASHVKVISW